MPHIRALFPEDAAVRKLLIEHKTMLRRLLADVSGYELEEIIFIPEPIGQEDMGLADNLLPLELVIDVGNKVLTGPMASECALGYIGRVLQFCPGFDALKFGVWVRSFTVNEYTEFKPD